MRKYLMIFLLIGSIGVTLAHAGQRMTASNGAHLEMPDLATLDCDRMDRLLIDYALAGYRGPQPVPDGHPDRPLYDYENALARRHYKLCQSDASSYGTPFEAFGRGFD